MSNSSTFTLHQIPIFERLATSKTILLAGAGGGFDIFSGIPLYFSLKKQGKNVILANFSFTRLTETTSEPIFPCCYKIRRGDSDLSGRRYFPERLLKTWFKSVTSIAEFNTQLTHYQSELVTLRGKKQLPI